ncbi:MAG: FAD-binding oxidoreductase [Planctomycetota bacterium]
MGNVPLWDRAAWDGLDRLDSTVEADVCVVGLGGSGLTAVHALLDRGARVVGVDAGAVARGAAGRNGGLLLAGLAPFYHDAVRALGRERASALYRATMDEQERIAATTPDHVRATGSLRIAEDDGELRDCERQREALERDGLPVGAYEGPEGRGLLFPTDLSMNPLERVRALTRSAAERGAQLFEQSPAREIAGDEVVAGEGRVRCRATIVAVDGGLERVLPELADRVRTARLQMLGTAPAVDVRLPRPIYVRYGYEYAQQLDDGSIALGGFRDRFEADEWTHDATPTEDVQGLLDAFLRERIGTNAEVTHRWAATVAYTDGPLPVVAEPRPDVWAIGAYSGTGNLIGALAGRAAAALASAESAPLVPLFTDPIGG